MNTQISSDKQYTNEQEYGKALNIIVSTFDSTNVETSTGITVLAEFLRGYRPGDRTAESGENMTSYEIAEMLSDMAEIPINVIAGTMTALGYGIHINENAGPEWAMVKI